MGLHPAVERFREWLTGEFRADGRFDGIHCLEGPEAGGVDLSFRLSTGPRTYYEVRVDLAAALLEAGFSTESRVVNEAIEELVLDNGGDLGELFGDELCDLGDEPLPVQHYFARPAFRFMAALPLPDAESLDQDVLRRRVRNVLASARVLFQESIDGA